MISIVRKNGIRKISGEDVTRGESWEGIGSFWSGYAALLTDITGGFMLVMPLFSMKEFDKIIDSELAQLDYESRNVLCFYYGLQSRAKHTLEQTASCMNAISFGKLYFTEDSVEKILNNAIEQLSKSEIIHDYITQRTETAQ